MVDRNSITKLMGRVRSTSSPIRTGLRHDTRIKLSERKIISSSKKIRAIKLINELSKEDREELIGSFVGNSQHIISAIITSLKEVLHNRDSSDSDHEAVRSTIISACCGPNIKLRALSEVLEIYQNRNYHRLPGRHDAAITTICTHRANNKKRAFLSDG